MVDSRLPQKEGVYIWMKTQGSIAGKHYDGSRLNRVNLNFFFFRTREIHCIWTPTKHSIVNYTVNPTAYIVEDDQNIFLHDWFQYKDTNKRSKLER